MENEEIKNIEETDTSMNEDSADKDKNVRVDDKEKNENERKLLSEGGEK